MRHGSFAPVDFKSDLSTRRLRVFAAVRAAVFHLIGFELNDRDFRIVDTRTSTGPIFSKLIPMLAIGILVFTASCGTAALDDGYYDRYLKGRSRSPYTGRVIDAETRQPLEGAVVVAVWERDIFAVVHMVSEHYAAREVLTDRDGRFVIEAKRLEERAPRRTLRPTLTILALGYGFFPAFQTHPRDLAGGDIFEGKGATVELRRLAPNERRAQVSWFDPFGLSPSPFEAIPQFMRLVNRERELVGVEPYPPPEKR